MNSAVVYNLPPISILSRSATLAMMSTDFDPPDPPRQPELFTLGGDDGWKAFLLPRSSAMTIRELGDRHLAQLERAGKPYRRLAGIFRAHLYPAFGDAKLVELETGWFCAWAAYLVAKRPAGKGLRPSTARKLLAKAKALLERAVAAKIIHHNPARVPRGTIASKGVDELQHASSVLTLTEYRKVLFDERVALPRRLFRGLLLLTGMRVSEAIALPWRHVRPSPIKDGLRMIIVACGVDGDSGELVDHTKTRAVKYVPAHPVLEELLVEGRAWFRGAVGRDPGDDDLVAPLVRRRRPNPRAERTELEAWDRDLAKLGIAKRTLHKARHTFISRLKAAGADETITHKFTHRRPLERADVVEGSFADYLALEWELSCRELLKLEIPRPAPQLDLFT